MRALEIFGAVSLYVVLPVAVIVAALEAIRRRSRQKRQQVRGFGVLPKRKS